MNKTAIKNFAIAARLTLIDAVTQRAFEYEVTENGKNNPDQAEVNGKALTPTELSQRRQLIDRISQNGFAQTMEEAAYTWFNRFIALRFMEVNGYLPTRIRVFTDENNAFKPEILAEASRIELDGIDHDYIMDLLDAQQNDTLYKYLLIAQCNALNCGLPEMFEEIGGWTELLFPNNLLRNDSVIAHMVEDIPEEDWRDQVQIIGWLYQYYITELNELVYDGRMSKDKIPKHLISAATTIYTPDWAVRYMVDNSLGRLWAEGHGKPENADWKYYLEEAEQEDSVKVELEKLRAEYKSIQPEQIKVIDPCMGSGHILVYAFDVLMDIYTSCGWSERDAALSILQHNLYGLDIDRRAYQLAYFAVMMKARQYNRSIIKNGEVQPQLANFADVMGVDIDLIPGKIREFVEQFKFADIYGSLMEIIAPDGLDEAVSEFNASFGISRKQLDMMLLIYKNLSQKYDVVVTNPPYLGSSRFLPELAEFITSGYKDEKNDLAMAMFRHSVDDLVTDKGFVSFITSSSWLFLSSFEKTRKYIISNYQLDSLVDFGTELFDGKVGHNPIVSWSLRKIKPHKKILAIRLVDYRYARRDEKEPEFFQMHNRFTTMQDSFFHIPGMPVAYWISDRFRDVFSNLAIKDIGSSCVGLVTGDNTRFIRKWYEINYQLLGTGMSRDDAISSDELKWFPINQTGEYRKWYGLYLDVFDWWHNGQNIKQFKHERYLRGEVEKKNSKCWNEEKYFCEGLTWNRICYDKFSARYSPTGNTAGTNCPIYFPQSNSMYILGLLNSKVIKAIVALLNPTVTFQAQDLQRIPVMIETRYLTSVTQLVDDNIQQSKADWDSFELSWDFEQHPLI